MWDIKHAHKWIMIPHTYYEIMRELRVREPRQTCMVFDKRYYDIDTGKLCTDKISSIKGYSLAEITESNYVREYIPGLSEHYKQIESNIPFFIPKDNDFDEECARDEREKKNSELQQKIEITKRKQKEDEEKVSADNFCYLGGHQHDQSVKNSTYIITWSGREKVG